MRRHRLLLRRSLEELKTEHDPDGGGDQKAEE
jgi:hypothetical protein